jgi:hypothetical protein
VARFRRTRKSQLRAYGIIQFNADGVPVGFLPPGETRTVTITEPADLQRFIQAGQVMPDDLQRLAEWGER